MIFPFADLFLTNKDGTVPFAWTLSTTNPAYGNDCIIGTAPITNGASVSMQCHSGAPTLSILFWTGPGCTGLEVNACLNLPLVDFTVSPFHAHFRALSAQGVNCAALVSNGYTDWYVDG
jgi:hypothetical protein